MQKAPTTSPAAPGTEYVTERELASRTPLSRYSWQNMRRRGIGPAFYRVGSTRVLYKWAEVCAWLETNRVGGAK